MSYYSVDDICTKFINACEKGNFSEFTKLVLDETVQECVIDKLAGKITEDRFIQYEQRVGKLEPPDSFSTIFHGLFCKVHEDKLNEISNLIEKKFESIADKDFVDYLVTESGNKLTRSSICYMLNNQTCLNKIVNKFTINDNIFKNADQYIKLNPTKYSYIINISKEIKQYKYFKFAYDILRTIVDQNKVEEILKFGDLSDAVKNCLSSYIETKCETLNDVLSGLKGCLNGLSLENYKTMQAEREKLQLSIDNLNKAVEDKIGLYHKMENENKAIKEKLSKSNYEALKSENEALKSENEALKSENESLKSEKEELEEKLYDITESYSKLENDNKYYRNLDNRNTELIAENKRLRNDLDDTIQNKDIIINKLEQKQQELKEQLTLNEQKQQELNKKESNPYKVHKPKEKKEIIKDLKGLLGTDQTYPRYCNFDTLSTILNSYNISKGLENIDENAKSVMEDLKNFLYLLTNNISKMTITYDIDMSYNYLMKVLSGEYTDKYAIMITFTYPNTKYTPEMLSILAIFDNTIRCMRGYTDHSKPENSDSEPIEAEKIAFSILKHITENRLTETKSKKPSKTTKQFICEKTGKPYIEEEELEEQPEEEQIQEQPLNKPEEQPKEEQPLNKPKQPKQQPEEEQIQEQPLNKPIRKQPRNKLLPLPKRNQPEEEQPEERILYNGMYLSKTTIEYFKSVNCYDESLLGK